MQLVDYTLQQPIFTVPQAQKHLGLTYARVNRLVSQLIEAGVLRQYREASWGREFAAPEVLAIMTKAR